MTAGKPGLEITGERRADAAPRGHCLHGAGLPFSVHRGRIRAGLPERVACTVSFLDRVRDVILLLGKDMRHIEPYSESLSSVYFLFGKNISD